MKALLVSLHVKPDKRDQFLAAAQDDSTCSVRDEAGCLRFDVLHDTADENHFFFYEVYRDDAAFAEHATMPHFARWRAAAAECLDGQVERTDSEVLFPAPYN
jgi:(4S)-4-hydroxy-5-phosphonooxypentane-2,3-dione isomerase